MSNKMLNTSHGLTEKEQYMSILPVVHELRRFSPTAFNALMAATDPTSKAIKETLYNAAISGSDIELLESLREGGADLNALTSLCSRNPEMHIMKKGKASLYWDTGIAQTTALQYAASTCDLPMATFLIENGAKADLGSPTPLQILCSRPKNWYTLRFANLLLDKGARCGQKVPSDFHISDFFPPLMGAVARGNRDLVELFIQEGVPDVVIHADTPEDPTADGQGILQLHPLPYVTENEYQLNVSGQCWRQKITALQLAIVSNNGDILTMVIDAVSKQKDNHEIFEESFLTACLSGDEHIVQRLLSLDAQILHNQSLVNWAFVAIAWIPDCRIANLLLKNGAMPCEFPAPMVSALQMAALNGNLSLIKILKCCGLDVNSGHELQFEPLPYCEGIDCPPGIRSPLECAACMGHRAAAETLLGLGADAGDAALKYLVELESDTLIEAALLYCEVIYRPSHAELQDALGIAISHLKGRAIVCRILDAGASIGGHELVEAIHSDEEEVIQLLVARGANLLTTGKYGETVLEAAYQVGNFEMARRYFNCGGTYSSKALLHAVNVAVTMHFYCGLEDLVAKRPPGPIDKYEATGLLLSIRTSDVFLTTIFLGDDFRASSARSIYCWHAGLLLESSRMEIEDQRLIIDSEEPWKDETGFHQYHKCNRLCSPMLLAALMAEEGLIKTMISRGYQPDVLLMETIYYNQSPTIKYAIREMLKAAFPMSLIREPSLHHRLLLAAIRGSACPEMIRQHLSEMTSHDAWDNGSENPLTFAARIGDIESLKIILEAGAIVDWQEPENYLTALRGALLRRHWKIASLLLEHGADVNSCEFSLVARRGDLEVATFLLEKGADVNATSPVETALERAANYGRIDMVELLLSHGFNVQGRERIRFVRAVNFAIQRCHYATADILKDRGGWDAEDVELAQTRRAIERRHICDRFLYDDASLPECRHCESADDPSPQSGFAEEVPDPASPVASSVTQYSEFSYGAADSPFDGLITLDDGFHAPMMPQWSFGPYTALDRERDDTARRMLEEYEGHILGGTEWSLVPYQAPEGDLNAEDSMILDEYEGHRLEGTEWPFVPCQAAEEDNNAEDSMMLDG